jgi:hypothetical protein
MMNRTGLMTLGVALLAAMNISAISYSPVVKVVPGPGLPDRVDCMDSNNNLDIVRFDGRLFLGFRTAPDHFAGRKTMLYIVSSIDEGETWDYEAEVFMGTDMREPRFLALDDKLMFYFFQAGTNRMAFEPRFMFAMHREGPGDWTEPVKIYQPGCIPWRAMTHKGKVYFTVHCGGAMFSEAAEGSQKGVHFLTTQNGYDLLPVNPTRPIAVERGGETAFAFDDDDTLYLTLRSGGEPPESFSSSVCKATPDDYSDWECVQTKYKYASPFMFAHDGEIYLIARWSLDGVYDKEWRWMPDPMEGLAYEARYWWTGKRTALYRLDKDNLVMERLFDFPSKGDTAFPGMVEIDENSYLMYNYSNDPEGRDRIWMNGQLGKTNIYSTIIMFE